MLSFMSHGAIKDFVDVCVRVRVRLIEVCMSLLPLTALVCQLSSGHGLDRHGARGVTSSWNTTVYTLTSPVWEN